MQSNRAVYKDTLYRYHTREANLRQSMREEIIWWNFSFEFFKNRQIEWLVSNIECQFWLTFKVVSARDRFYSKIAQILPIYYLRLLEYMCEVSRLLTVQDARKLSLKNKLKQRLNMEFPMLCENWTTFNITIHKYFLTLQSKFYGRLKVVSHFMSQNLEAIDHPLPEINNYNDRHMVFQHSCDISRV